MHIGIAGPVTLALLRHLVQKPGSVPEGYAFPNTASLVLELLDRGHEVSVFALDSAVAGPSVHEGRGLKIHVAPMRPRARHRSQDLFALERHGLARAIASSACDVVHAHWTYEFALGAQEAGLPLVVTAHDAPLTVARINRHPYWWIRAAMAGVAVHRARTLTAVAPSVADQLRRVYGYRRPITVVPNGISREIFQRPTTEPDPSSPVFVSVAHGWGPRKNVKTAIDAFAVVRRRHQHARLILFGSGHGSGEGAEQYAVRAGRDARCEFRGAVSREEVLDTLASGVTALVHPSRFEAHSVAVSEAMALGLCVIGGARSGGMPWTLGYGAAGMLVDVDDATAVAAAMLAAIEDPHRRSELAAAARAHAQSNYALPVVAARYEEAYTAALTSGD